MISCIVQNALDGFGSANRQGRFLNDNFIAFGNFGNLSSTQFDIFQIGGHPFTFTISFGRRIYRYKNNLSFVYCFFNIGRKKQIPTSSFGNNCTQPRLVNRDILGIFIIPSSYSFGIHVYHRDLYMRTFLRYNSHCWSSNISCSYATNFINFHFLFYYLFIFFNSQFRTDAIYRVSTTTPYRRDKSRLYKFFQYQSTASFNPSFKENLGSYPNNDFAFSILANEWGISPARFGPYSIGTSAIFGLYFDKYSFK